MSNFPKDRLVPISARLTAAALAEAGLEIAFKPFSVPDPDGGDALAFDRPLIAEGIEWPANSIADLIGRALHFPINPEDGYIDASVYFADVHNPVDITTLRFDAGPEGGIIVTITSRWLMAFEGTGFDDFDVTFTVPIER